MTGTDLYFLDTARDRSTFSLAEVVRAGRDATAALYAIANRGGGTRATLNAQDRHAWALVAVHAELVARGRRDLSGAITEEDSLRERIAGDKRAGRPVRVELAARVSAVRRTLRAL